MKSTAVFRLRWGLPYPPKKMSSFTVGILPTISYST